MNEQVGSAELASALPENRGGAKHIVAPAPSALLRQLVEIKFKVAGEFFGMNEKPAIIPGAEGNVHRKFDSRGHDEAVVVIGVLADKVYAAGRARNSRPRAEDLFKTLSKFR